MDFKSLPQLLDHFKEEATCIECYEQIRWNGNPVCHHCGTENPYKTNRGYKCSNPDCYKKFTVKTGTIFENSKIKFRIWFAAIYLCTVHKKGISSVQLSIDLGITQKTAWFVLHRVREMLANQAPHMLGENSMVEADESYVGGKESNRHYAKKQSELNAEYANDGSKYNKKKIVVGMVERNGKIILKHVPNAKAGNMVPFIKKHVPAGAVINTDEHSAYKKLSTSYTHNTVVHSLNIYVVGNTHTNTIENFWSLLKRGLYGIYHQVSDKHFQRYLNEFAARYNARQNDSVEKLVKTLSTTKGRLKYNSLIGKA